MKAVLVALMACTNCESDAQAISDALAIKSIAEVQTKAQLTPAERVVPGDYLIYTLEVRNISPQTLPSPTVTNAIPAHMSYVAGSAVGPGADVSYSVDGGRTFDRAENLKVDIAGGGTRPALAADYTHIRWQLRNSLKSKSVAYVRFRTLVK